MPSNRPYRPFSLHLRMGTKLRSGAALGILTALVLGIAVDASSQTTPSANTSPGGSTPSAGGKQPLTKKGKGKKGKANPTASASAAVSAAPPASAAMTASEPAPVVSTTPIPTVVRKLAPPPPPPSDRQLRALEQLHHETSDYEKDARDFRDAITTVVKQHYEERRRHILNGLDSEITIEKSDLQKAREEAIRRLEEFVARYSGPNAHPEHTPDAMFRLAALYEERARGDSSAEQLIAQLKPAIALYKRLIREFPNYREKAAVFYYLGHALNDSDRSPEAQQVWRSLVCYNKYPYPVPADPNDSEKDILVKKPQDHDPKYWEAWSNVHQEPIGQGSGKRAVATRRRSKAGQDEPMDQNEEISYRPIYSEECKPIPQKTEPGQEPRYIAEVWWQIGDYHFEQRDADSGPFNFNRAVTAYRLSMKGVQDKTKNVVYGVSMYKLAWAYFKQQRYEAAVRQFVSLLYYTDEREQVTGDSGADFRKEAYDYIAGSLTYADFIGPTEEEPFIIRQDVLDKETNPAIAEQKMRVGLDRVQDPKLIPQDKKWTIEIYKALSREYRELNQLANTTATLELILQKWPMHRDAPLIQDEIARTYDERAKYAKDGTPERDIFATRALDSRTRLAQYIGNTPWVDANHDDPEAIQTAERLVRGGLRQAAVEHTNNARANVSNANQTTVDAERRTWFDKAITEYRLAEGGWQAYLQQDENSTDAYESRFWLSDSRYWQVVLIVALDKPVSPQQYAAARQAAIDVRDSNEDDRFLEPTAQYVVSLADNAVQEQYKLYKASNGAQGFEERTELRVSGEAPNLRVDAAALPPQVVASVAARDEYVGRVPPQNDANRNSDLFHFQAAQAFFFYGQLDEANKRFESIYKEQCKKTKYGFLAWEKLQKIANVQGTISGDLSRSRQLAEAEQNPKTSCAVDETQKAVAESIIKPTIQGGFYVDAAAAFKRASEMPDGPDRAKAWKTAGALYETALKAAPDRKEAPEAAINGAFCYKQVGDYDKAIEMYRLFIDRYGDEKILSQLEKSDKPEEKKEYGERVKYLSDAYKALSQSYVLFFNYRAAAETSDKISTIERFDPQQRRDAARNALVLYSNLGDRPKMEAARARFLSLKPNAEDTAEADYIVSSADLKLWDERGADTGSNKDASVKAMTALMGYYDKNKNNPAATRYNVDAAYHVAKMKRAANDLKTDDWWKNTIASFERYKAGAPAKDGKNPALGSLEGDMAAEADFALADADIRKNFDYDTGHHRYAGTVLDVTKKYNNDAKEAEKYHARLKRIAEPTTYGSLEYVTAALARQGSLYDSLRTGLFNTREPQLKLFSPQEDSLLKKLEASGNEDYMDKAAEKRDQRVNLWRQKRDQELTSADTIMVQRYTAAVTIARKYNVRSAAVNKALQRLAFFTDVLGDAKMRQYSSSVEGFTYSDGMFQKTRPGMVVEPNVPVLPEPLPVVVPQ